MINYNKNKLINTCLIKYYETFEHTLDTADYVPQKYNDKICKYIFKNMKKAFKKIDKEDKVYQKGLVKKAKEKVKAEAKAAKAAKPKKQSKFVNFFKRIGRFFKRLFTRKSKKKQGGN